MKPDASTFVAVKTTDGRSEGCTVPQIVHEPRLFVVHWPSRPGANVPCTTAPMTALPVPVSRVSTVTCGRQLRPDRAAEPASDLSATYFGGGSSNKPNTSK